jgi:uncharacterized protein (TIGR02145 family)
MKANKILLVIFRMIEMKKLTFAFLIGCSNFCISQVIINGVNWSTVDLNSTKFQNGDVLFVAKNMEEWKEKCSKKESCAYELKDSKGSRFIYNCYALDDTRKINPKGTRIATKEDWNNLIKSFGGELTSASSLRDSKEWDVINEKSEVSGLNLKPGFTIESNILLITTNFLGDTLKNNVHYWCYEKTNDNFCNSISIGESNEVSFTNINKECGYYVRCILDDKEVNIKDVSLVKIGSFYWQNQNCRITKYINGDPIFFAKNSTELDEANKRKEGAYCFINFNNQLDSNYIVYNWYAIMDPRGFGTMDLRLPNWADWKNLIATIEGDKKTINDLKKTEEWTVNKSYPISNYYGFNGIPTFYGYADSYYQRENFSKTNGMYFWIPDDNVGSYYNLEEGKAYQSSFVINGFNSFVDDFENTFYRQSIKSSMFPVRLVKGTTSYFDGTVVSGKKQGHGKLHVRNDDNYRYDFVNFVNVQPGSIIEGNWIDNNLQGRSTITWIDGTTEDALFTNNLHQGALRIDQNKTQKCLYDGKTFSSHYKKTSAEIEAEKSSTKSIVIRAYKTELYCNSTCEAKAEEERLARQRESQNSQQNQNSTTSKSSNKGNCSYCGGTGECRGCAHSIDKPYLDECSTKSRKEMRFGYVLCKQCFGYGYKREIASKCDCKNGVGQCPGEKCYISSCTDGWVYCTECNQSSKGENIGKCSHCKGSGQEKN